MKREEFIFKKLIDKLTKKDAELPRQFKWYGDYLVEINFNYADQIDFAVLRWDRCRYIKIVECRIYFDVKECIFIDWYQSRFLHYIKDALISLYEPQGVFDKEFDFDFDDWWIGELKEDINNIDFDADYNAAMEFYNEEFAPEIALYEEITNKVLDFAKR